MGVNNNPYTAMLDLQRQQVRAAADAMEKAAEAPDRAERMGAVEVGQTPSEVVYRENKLELLHYESRTDEQYDVPILIVYALINRPYILDLQPDRSVVRTLLEQGFDVYMIDWNEPSFLDQHLTLDDYVNRYVDNCVDVVRERSGQDAINVLGYCMGGTMSVMYAALHPEKVRNLALMAAGLCFDDTGGVLELWGGEEYYEPAALRETFGNVPSDFLDVGFALMDPVDNFLTKYVRLYDNIEDEDFVENFARMERWLGDGIDVAGETYTQFLEDIYQDNKLARNELTVGGKRIDLANVRMPILQIVGEYDHLIPPEASKPFNELVGSEDVTTMEASTGHIGLSVSSRSHAELWPDVCDWFAARSDVEEAADDGETEAEAEVEVETEADEADATSAAAEPAVSGDGGPATVPTEADAAGPDVEGDSESDSEAESDVEADTDADADADPESDAEPEADTDADVPDVRDLRGVGPTYASRLRDGGYRDVAALAADDPETVAEAADVPVGRARDWIEQARELLDRDAEDDGDADAA